eukprot:TRINITY_DN11148_c0_g1_i2.p2 TRINITY_DN11148_c0_g1~~TRINITY_DN11148_c0_g1_i2.p2  ORF type:complete len:107 (+),score=15.55 TRINITY_DN11148_c0_g1_i2:62-382(+)
MCIRDRYMGRHFTTVTAIGSDEKEKYLLTGSEFGDVILWRITPEVKMQQVHHFFHHEAQVTSVSFNNECRVFTTSSLDGTCNVYYIKTGQLLRTCLLYTSPSPRDS